MRNWYIPATVIGLAGLGLAVASEQGRSRLRRFFSAIAQSPRLGEFNDVIDSELNNIQQALDQIADTLSSPSDASRRLVR